MANLASALLEAKGKLKKTEPPAERTIKRHTEAGDFLGFLKDAEELERIRTVTGIRTEEQRISYYLNGGVDAWYDELKVNLASQNAPSTSNPSIDEITFPTTVVPFSHVEKEALFQLFQDVFGEGVTSGVLSCCGSVLECGIDRVERIIDSSLRKDKDSAPYSSEDGLGFNWRPLAQKLDDAVRRHGANAFVKLSTRSPKDSFAAMAKARIRWDGAESVATKDPRERLRDESLDHNELWVRFCERLRLNLCAQSGRDALILLATSLRVWEDLESDLGVTKSGMPLAGNAEVEQKTGSGVQIIVRAFDPGVVPATEFRGFVWGGHFTCCAQYFHQLHFPELEQRRSEIEADLRAFYDRLVWPNIPRYLADCCPCFLMDLVWKKDGPDSRVLLTEINPFDGEAIGTFPASTGLFLWEREADRRRIMGEAARVQEGFGESGELDFELRLRKEPLITAKNLQSHPALRNLSAVWKWAIYGVE